MASEHTEASPSAGKGEASLREYSGRWRTVGQIERDCKSDYCIFCLFNLHTLHTHDSTDTETVPYVACTATYWPEVLIFCTSKGKAVY